MIGLRALAGVPEAVKARLYMAVQAGIIWGHRIGTLFFASGLFWVKLSNRYSLRYSIIMIKMIVLAHLT